MGRLLIQFAGTNTTKALSETLPKNTIIVDEDLHQLRLHDGTTRGGHIIGGSGGGGVPVGTIIPFAGNSIPEGYLLCDGSAISRTDYATLFAVIGTIYGTGDGNSTFNLPNWGNHGFVGNAPTISNTVVYGGTNGNTILAMHYGNGEGSFDRKGYVIATTYSGNPAYMRGIVTTSSEFDSNQRIKNNITMTRYNWSKYYIKYI